MNQKQRSYIIKDLESIRVKKQSKLLYEFHDKMATPWSIIEDIKLGSISVLGDDTEVNTSLRNNIPDDQKIMMIKMDLASIKSNYFYITKKNYIEAIRRGIKVINNKEEITERLQGISNDYLNAMRVLFNISVVYPESTPEYILRLSALNEEYKRVERTIMLGENSEVLSILKEFEDKLF